MRCFKFLAALLLLAPFSQMAKADLCADPTTGAWITCSAAPSATGANYDTTTIASPNSLSQTFDVITYGAKCDGSTHDDVAINSAFSAARTAYSSYVSVMVRFPPLKNCLVYGPINATGFNTFGHQLIVEGQGSTLLANSTYVGPIIDMLGTSYAVMRDLTVVAYLGTQTYGIQGGRYTTASAQANLFENVQAVGKFTKGACYFNATEVSTFIGLVCDNSTTSGAVFGLILDAMNHWNVTSSFVTVTAAVDTITSMASNNFVSPQLGVYSSSGAALWEGGIGQMTMTNCYAYNLSASAAIGAFLYTTADVSPYESNRLQTLDCHFEGSAPTALAYEFWITGPGSGATFTATPNIRSLEYKDLDAWASTAVFGIDPASNITTVTLSNLNLNIPRARNVITVFDTPASYNVTGEAYLNDTAMWNGLSTWQVKVNAGGVLTEGLSALYLSGNHNAPTFSTSGVGLDIAAQTITDTTTANSATLASVYVNRIGRPTLTTSGTGVTISTAETLNIDNCPAAGTNVTITNCGALRVGGGLSSFYGMVQPNAGITVTGAGSSINSSSNFATSINTGTSNGTVTIGGGSNAVTLNATTLSLTGTLAGTSISNYLASPPAIGGSAPAAGSFTTLNATGAITSTLATGTAPFTVASTTNVANLNASSLSGATFAAPGAIGGGTPSTGAFTSTTATTSASVAGFKVGYPVLQGAIPFVLPPSAFHAANGVVVLGQAPGGSATATFGATSGSTTITFSAGTNLTGSSADVGRVITILDTTYKYFTITTGTSSTVATGTLSATLSGVGPFANNVLWISGTFATTNTAGTDAVMHSSPLPRVIGNSFSYWPANSVTASNSAGWYWTVWASTTVGTVNTDTYTTGTPTVVASPVAYAVAGNGAVTQTSATYLTGPQLSLAGNSMGINGALEWVWLSSANNTAGSKVSAAYYAATKVGQANASGSTIVAVGGFSSVTNRGVTNAQVSNVGNGATGGFTTSATLPLVQAIDTTAAQVCAFAVNLNSAATDVNVLESYSLKLYPNP